ncbi:DUF433 domain-containing protein [Tangfeifania diversioriginum]|uniref:DUF433 domain-containing protein n=1 Tax=Tangfeifania diversioriginum TaxID=1168035 RepID=UPI001FEC1AA1|nr:DUF433 domain-containing protein [Tangfeifania diversioriginum]
MFLVFLNKKVTMLLNERITLEPGKRSGKPCVRGMRITVADVLSYLASGMSFEEILDDFPNLEREDILACLSYAANKEKIELCA